MFLGSLTSNLTSRVEKYLLRLFRSGLNNNIAYKEVNISSAQILAMFTSPIELVAAPLDASQYIDPVKIIVEYNFNTTPYTVAPGDFVVSSIGSEQSVSFDATSMLGAGANRVYILNGIHGASVDLLLGILNGPASGIAQALYLKTVIGDPTLGDGTLKVKVWYNIQTIG